MGVESMVPSPPFPFLPRCCGCNTASVFRESVTKSFFVQTGQLWVVWVWCYAAASSDSPRPFIIFIHVGCRGLHGACSRPMCSYGLVQGMRSNSRGVYGTCTRSVGKCGSGEWKSLFKTCGCLTSLLLSKRQSGVVVWRKV